MMSNSQCSAQIHILGICGTFMGGVALLAKESGAKVTGSDENVYPPMSTLLESNGIKVTSGFKSKNLDDPVGQVIVGNVMTRGMDVIEEMLNKKLLYTSGPQWLYENILKGRWVLAVSGTHGKTTTASILAWILEYAGLNPGFLIGGVPENFGVSARLGESPFFVVEADEYDTAFFDKRSKFVHYHPSTLIINNLEYDHADIFPDIEAIKTQFHHLMRMLPSEGLAVANGDDDSVKDVLNKGCWTPVENFSSEGASIQGWKASYINTDGSKFDVIFDNEIQGRVEWTLLGEHNVSNALAAIAAARHAGVPVEHAIAALTEFKGIKRRMELRAEVNGIRIYDDFAHHPTAIKTTLKGLRENVGNQKIIAILEPRSNTMRLGIHKASLADSLQVADEVILFEPKGLDWNIDDLVSSLGDKAKKYTEVDTLVANVVKSVNSGDQLLVMSNGGFDGVHEKLIEALG